MSSRAFAAECGVVKSSSIELRCTCVLTLLLFFGQVEVEIVGQCCSVAVLCVPHANHAAEQVFILC